MDRYEECDSTHVNWVGSTIFGLLRSQIQTRSTQSINPHKKSKPHLPFPFSTPLTLFLPPLSSPLPASPTTTHPPLPPCALCGLDPPSFFPCSCLFNLSSAKLPRIAPPIAPSRPCPTWWPPKPPASPPVMAPPRPRSVSWGYWGWVWL